jgi:hypothetical protein
MIDEQGSTQTTTWGTRSCHDCAWDIHEAKDPGIRKISAFHIGEIHRIRGEKDQSYSVDWV